MKQFIFALFLLFAPISIATPIIIPEPVTEIPLGVEIRGDMATMFLICGKPHAVVLHTTTGIQIFQGTEMIQKLKEMDEGNGIPVIKTDLSDAWDEDMCSAPATVDEPDHRSVPIEEINKGKRQWSASYQP
jgi:hypothetical protein